MNDNGNADILRQKNYNAVSRTIILSYKFSVQNYADGLVIEYSHSIRKITLNENFYYLISVEL